MGQRVLGTLLNASSLLQQSCSRRGLENEGEGTILVNGDLDRDDLAHLVLRLGIVCLAEIHDVHAVGTQSRAQRRGRVGLASLNLELDQRRDFLLGSHNMVLLSITRFKWSPSVSIYSAQSVLTH